MTDDRGPMSRYISLSCGAAAAEFVVVLIPCPREFSDSRGHAQVQT
jgi:hypothetical protein